MKKIILSLLVGFLGFISFGFCDTISYTSGFVLMDSMSFVGIREGDGYFCFYVEGGNEWGSNGTLNLGYGYDNSAGSFQGWKSFSFLNEFPTCLILTGLNQISFSTDNTPYYGFFPFGGSSECDSCPEVNTGEILSGYILESDIDSGYCFENNLCSDSSGINWSELKINDIVHQSAPFINITIPEEFNWDYTVDENEFDLDVEGYNVDTDYIAGIINTQNSKPNQADLNNIIQNVLPLFVPGLVIILFIYFVFRFVKKIF